MSAYEPEIEEALQKFATTKYAVLEGTRTSQVMKIAGASGKDDWRQYGASRPVVAYNWDDEKYYLFARGATEDYIDGDAAEEIGVFTSDELLDWTEYEKNPVLSPTAADEARLWPSSVFWDPQNEIWRMLYDAPNGAGSINIKLATSPDLLDWTRQGVVISDAKSAKYAWLDATGGNLIASVFDNVNVRLDIYKSTDWGASWSFDHTVDADISRSGNPFRAWPGPPEIHTMAKVGNVFLILAEHRQPTYSEHSLSGYASYEDPKEGSWVQIPEIIHHSTSQKGSEQAWNITHPELVFGPRGALLFHCKVSQVSASDFLEEIWLSRLDPEAFLGKLLSRCQYPFAVSESYTGGTWLETDINLLRWESKTLHFSSDTSGDLTVDVAPDQTDDWRTLFTRTGITEDITQSRQDFARMRIKFSVDATITAKLVCRR